MLSASDGEREKGRGRARAQEKGCCSSRRRNLTHMQSWSCFSLLSSFWKWTAFSAGKRTQGFISNLLHLIELNWIYIYFVCVCVCETQNLKAGAILEATVCSTLLCFAAAIMAATPGYNPVSSSHHPVSVFSLSLSLSLFSSSLWILPSCHTSIWTGISNQVIIAFVLEEVAEKPSVIGKINTCFFSFFFSLHNRVWIEFVWGRYDLLCSCLLCWAVFCKIKIPCALASIPMNTALVSPQQGRERQIFLMMSNNTNLSRQFFLTETFTGWGVALLCFRTIAVEVYQVRSTFFSVKCSLSI